MTTEKESNDLAMKMALEKALSELEKEMTDFKKKNPGVLSFSESKDLQKRYEDKKQEYIKSRTEGDNIAAQMRDLDSKARFMSEQQRYSEMKRLSDLAATHKKEFEYVQNELQEIGERLKVTSTQVNIEYIKLERNRNALVKRINTLSQPEQKKPLTSHSNMQAEKKGSPFGPFLPNNHLLETIAKSTEWQKAFVDKYKLEIVQDNKSINKLQFVSKEKNIQIEVTNEKISGHWGKENEQSAITMMVELYVKAIKNQKVDNHKIDGKNPDVTQLIELELAKQLKAIGVNKADINNKALDKIINSESTIEDPDRENPSPS